MQLLLISRRTVVEDYEINDESFVVKVFMTPDEFAEFTQGRGGTASYSVTDSSGQTVSYALPSTLDLPQKYYVVFRNPGGKSSPKTVKAELTASF